MIGEKETGFARSSKWRPGRLLASEWVFADSTGQLPRLRHYLRCHPSVQEAGNQPPTTVDANLLTQGTLPDRSLEDVVRWRAPRLLGISQSVPSHPKFFPRVPLDWIHLPRETAGSRR